MLANIIEGNVTSKAQLDLENASDEEEKYSAVVRPGHGGGSSEQHPRERREHRDFRDFREARSGGSSNSSGPCKTLSLSLSL